MTDWVKIPPHLLSTYGVKTAMDIQRRELLKQQQQQTEQPLPQIDPDMAPEATGQEWRG